MVYYNIHCHSELAFLTEWDYDNNSTMNDEILFDTSNDDAACKVLEQWQANQDELGCCCEDDTMEVEKHNIIDFNLLDNDDDNDDILVEQQLQQQDQLRCVSPCGPHDELAYNMNIDEDLKCLDATTATTTIHNDVDDDDEFYNYDNVPATSVFDFESTYISNILPTQLNNSLSSEDQYQISLQKLAESMKRSQETRKSLKMNTTTITERYSRKTSVTGVISSIEKSSYQLQTYLKQHM